MDEWGCLTKGILYKGNKMTRLSFRVKRSETEESPQDITAKQSYRAKILRLAALAQDDSLFYRVRLFVHFFLMRQRLFLWLIVCGRGQTHHI